MPFYFTCPYCYKKTLVDDDVAGKTGPCVRCAKLVTVAAPPTRAPDRAQPVDSGYVTLPERRPLAARTMWILRLLGVGVCIAVFFGAGFYVLRPTIQVLKTRRDKVACMNNLSKIAIALNSYASKHGTYPPPIVFDAAGKPLYSWRVLVLPELGETALYDSFNLDEPWDSPDNIQMVGQHSPKVFISPAVADRRNVSDTNYFLITGTGTVFPSTGPSQPNDIKDGLDRTVIVVESESRLIEWSQPGDIDFSKLNPNIGARGPNTIGGNHRGGAAAAFADGTAAWLPNTLQPQQLDAVITPAAGEPVEPNDFVLQ